ncbi:transcription termination factor Rho [Serinicoccus chungangensis]|uniref:Transcription termination factor Rho n=1 Tax=Serinicoccus chungangensis TaxID=767452 RepID=A0A0W8I8R0_9MICO|nr:transcription termination factor Rho [Serinicoccus chungangensis]KUG55701.1 transcription termination factor Rho [Serinicoccus chungangensis]
MTEITDAGATRTGALSTLRLAELQELASGMGITVNNKMRKADLVSAIREQRGGAASSNGSAGRQDAIEAALDRAQAEREETTGTAGGSRTRRSRRGGSSAGAPRTEQDRQADQQERTEGQDRSGGDPVAEGSAPTGEEHRDGGRRTQDDRQGQQGRDGRQDDRREGGQRTQDDRQGQQGRDGRQDDRQGQQGRQDDRREGGQRPQDDRQGQQGRDGDGDWGDDEGGRRGRRRSRNRNRDRKRGRGAQPASGGQQQQDAPESYSEEDVLVPVGGVVDLLDNYAFIRTTGYLPGPTDVYVPMGLVKKHGLRKGDAVTGAIKAPQDGSDVGQHTVSSTGNKRDKGKFSALVRLDSINGQEPDQGRRRPDFSSLTPLYPQQRLRLETEQKNLTTRVIDLVTPIGKGQRGLIVSPPKAGKTMVMQSIANAITTNNPEVHLMIVLVDERPEEVTDFQRSVKGEVISSTFDRPASDHTMVAELAIERAKRLVELGQDVVVLLDGITRLGRAYNLAAPASGRILSGGVDSAALYPPKKFFGAARNIEEGGSLTILATALVETGSKMDEVIFEEFKGTGNMELKLSRHLADRRTFPAVDVNASSTRREEILMSSEELKIMWKLRRVLSALDQQQGIELLLDRLKKTKHNYEFLTQVQQTSSVRLDDDD